MFFTKKYKERIKKLEEQIDFMNKEVNLLRYGNGENQYTDLIKTSKRIIHNTEYLRFANASKDILFIESNMPNVFYSYKRTKLDDFLSYKVIDNEIHIYYGDEILFQVIVVNNGHIDLVYIIYEYNCIARINLDTRSNKCIVDRGFDIGEMIYQITYIMYTINDQYNYVIDLISGMNNEDNSKILNKAKSHIQEAFDKFKYKFLFYNNSDEDKEEDEGDDND